MRSSNLRFYGLIVYNRVQYPPLSTRTLAQPYLRFMSPHETALFCIGNGAVNVTAKPEPKDSLEVRPPRSAVPTWQPWILLSSS